MKKMRKRALSWLLTLAMTLSMLPAPVAQAVEGLNVSIAKLDPKTGAYTVEITNGPHGGNSGNWAFALVPDIKASAGDATAGELMTAKNINKDTQTPAQMLTQIGKTGLPGSVYAVLGGSTPLAFDATGKATITGTLGAGGLDAIKAQFPDGYYTASGKVEAADITDIPYVAILVTKGGDAALASDSGGSLAHPPVPNITGTDISETGISSTIASGDTAGTSILTVTGKSAELGAITVSLTNAAGAVAPMSAAVDGVAQGETLSRDTDYNLVLKGTGNNVTATMPITGTIVVKYSDTDTGTEYSTSVSVSLFPASSPTGYFTITPVTFTFTEGQAAAEVQRSGGEVDTIVGGSATGNSKIYAAAQTGNATSAQGYVSLSGGVTDSYAVGAEIGIDLTASAKGLSAGIYSDSISYRGVMEKSADGTASTTNKYAIIPVTINVVAATGPNLSANPAMASWTTATNNATATSITLTETTGKGAYIMGTQWQSAIDSSASKFTSDLTTGGVSSSTTFTIVPNNGVLAAGDQYSDTLIITYKESALADNSTAKTIRIIADVDVPAAQKVFYKDGTPNLAFTVGDTFSVGNNITFYFDANDKTNDVTSAVTFAYAAAGASSINGLTNMPSTFTDTTLNGMHLYAVYNAESEFLDLGELVVTAATPITGAATVTLNKDTKAWTGSSVTLYPTGTTANGVSLNESSGVYTNTAVSFGSYDVYVGSTKTDATMTLDADNLTATATVNFFTLNVAASNGGTVTAPAGGSVVALAGNSVNFAVTAPGDYSLLDWTVAPTGAVTAPTGLTGTVTMPGTMTTDAGVTITANFIPNVKSAAISGHSGGGTNAKIGDTLTATGTDGANATITGNVTYQWYVGTTAVTAANGGTAATYKVLAADAGEAITVKITGDGTNYAGNVTSSAVNVLTAAALASNPVKWDVVANLDATVANKTFVLTNSGGTSTGALTATFTDGTYFEFASGGNISAIAGGGTANLEVKLKANATANAILTAVTDSIEIKDGATVLCTIGLSLKVNQATRAAVTLKDPVSPSTVGGTDGGFTINSYSGPASNYEYNTDGGATYTSGLPGTVAADGKVTGVGAATYHVRLAAGTSGNYIAGAAGSTTVSDPVAYTVSGTITYNGAAGTETVTYSDGIHTATATPDVSGVYTINNVLPTTTGTITVAGWTSANFAVSNANVTQNATLYDVTVVADSHSTGGATIKAYAVGDSVPLGVTANTGYEMDSWTLSGHTGGSFTAPGKTATSITVPGTGTGGIVLTAVTAAIKPTYIDASITNFVYATAANGQTVDTAALGYTGTDAITYTVQSKDAGLNWMTVASDTGVITGTPNTKPDTYTAVVRAANAITGGYTDATWTITIGMADVTITANTLFIDNAVGDSAPVLANLRDGATATAPVAGSTDVTNVKGTANPGLLGDWSITAPATFSATGGNATVKFTPSGASAGYYNPATETVAYTAVGFAIAAKNGSTTLDTGNAGLTLTGHNYNATPAAAVTVTIENTSSGTVSFTSDNIVLGGTDSSDFKLGGLPADTVTLTAGKTVDFTIEAETGLDAGTYNATVTVTATKAVVGGNVDTTFDVKVTVSKIALTTPTTGTVTSPTAYGGTGTVVIDNYTAIKTEDTGVVIEYQKDSGTWVTATIDDSGVVSGLGAGEYIFRAKPSTGGATNYTVSGNSNPAVEITAGTQYTGSVKVLVDTTEITSATSGVSTVKFHPAGGDGTSDVTASYSTDGWKATLDSTKGTYTVVVGTDAPSATVVVDGSTVTATSQSATAVQFYEVLVDATASVPQDADPVLTAPAITAKAIVGGVADTPISNNNIVLSGTTVTFAVASFDTTTYDYTTAWTTADTTGTLKYDGVKAMVKANLTRKLYTATGWADKGVASVSVSGETLDGKTINTGVYTGVIDSSTYAVTFADLPAGEYTFTGTLNADYAWATSGGPSFSNVRVESGTTAGLFTFVTKTPKRELTLSTPDTTPGTANDDLSETWDAVDYGYTPLPAKTVTVTNGGDLPVWLKLEGDETNYTVSGAINKTTGVEVAAGSTATFTLTFVTGKNANAAAYEGTFTVTSYKEAACTNAVGTAVAYKPSQTVNPIKITAAATTVGAPTVGSALGSASVADSGINYKVKSTTWKVGGSTVTGDAGNGKVYVAEVVLEPVSGNYAFDTNTTTAPLTGFTINGVGNGQAGADTGTATGSVAAGTVTLTYTFPVTPLATPGTVTVSNAEGTNYDAGKFTAAADSGTDLKYYYVVTSSAQTLSEAEIEAAANGTTPVTDQEIAGADTALSAVELSNLVQSNHKYFIYVVARSEKDGNTSGWSNIADGSFTTWYKLTVNATNVDSTNTTTNHNKATAAVGGKSVNALTDGSAAAVIGVPQASTGAGANVVTLGANTAGRGWKLKNWTTGGNVTFGSDAATAANTATVTGDATITASFHKIIHGAGVITGGNSFKVGDILTATVGAASGAGGIVIGSTQPADFTTNNTELTFQWQYDAGTSGAPNWTNVTGTGNATQAWTVTANNGDILGKPIRVMVTYTGDKDAALKDSVVYITADSTATKNLGDPSAQALKTAVRGDSGTTGLDAAVLAKGGLYLTFTMSADDAAANNPVASYQVLVKSGAATVETYTISARDATYFDGADTYKLHIPADTSKVKPTDAGTSVGQYTVEVKAIAETTSGLYGNSGAVTTTAAAAGKVVLTTAQLNPTLAGDNDGAIADGDAKFPTVGFDGTGKTATIVYKGGASAANAGVMTISYKQSSTAVAAPTNPGSYDVYVATAGASYYLGMAEVKLGSFEITAATISAIESTVTAPAAGGIPATGSVGSSVPGGAKYTITGVTWDPTAVTFGNGKVYTVEIEVAPVTGYKFASNATGKVNTVAVPNNSLTTGNRLDVASGGAKATLYYTFPATAPGAPTITDAGATAYNAGKLTELTATSDVNVKFYYQVKLATDPAPATAAAVKANATGNLTGTATGSTATWTYTAGQGELTLQANKEYKVYVVAETATNVLSADADIATKTFKTPYQVTVKADANGSVVIGGDTIAASGSKAYSVYGSQADATANTAATIAHVLTMEPTGTATTGFSKWTGGTPTETVPGGGTYTFTPSVSDTHTLTANFVATYNVVFDDNGATTPGTLPATLTGVKVGDEITLAAPTANPAKTGYKTPTHWSLKANNPQANEQYAFNGKLTVTAAMVQGLAAGGNINVYIVWTPEGFTVNSTTITPTYNTAAGEELLNLATLIPSGSGVGPFTYALSASADSAKGDPTAFMAVDGSKLVVKTGTRVGDVKADGYYECTLTVTDTGVTPNVAQTATITVNVKKATPQISGFTYNVGGTNYWGETVADATKIGGDVTDEMDTATSILADGEWTASPDKFVSNAVNDDPTTQDYVFTFTVKGAKAGNYNTATETVELTAEKRDPNIGVATDETSGTASKTVAVDYDAAVTGTDTVTVVVTNIGNSALNDLDVVLKSGDSPFAVANKDELNDVTELAELATNGTASFTITVPKMKDKGTYTAVFTVTAKSGTTPNEKTVSTDYTYTLKVNPATLKAADIEGLTAPAANAGWDNTVNAVAGGANTGKYVPTVAKWSDGTTDMGAGAKFENGKSYTVTLTLTPNANYVFDIGTDPADVYKLTVTGNPALTATASGNPKVSVNSTTGVATITYKFKALAPANVGVTVTPVDHETAKVTELKADSAVDANLYYVVLDAVNAGLSEAQIKNLATGGSETITGNILARGMKLGTSAAGVAKWEPTVGSDEIILTGLTGGSKYFAYAAAQSASDPNGELAKGDKDVTTGKELTVVTTEGGTVSNALLTGGKLAADSSESITVAADTSFTATAKTSGSTALYQFVKWNMTTQGDVNGGTYSYVLNDRTTGDTLNAYFAKNLTGTITVANSNSNDAPAVGDVLSPLEGNDLKLGDVAMTDLAGNTSMSYKWQYQAAGGNTWSNMGVTSRTWTVTKGTGGNDTSYVGAAFRVVVTYTETVGGTPATSAVTSDATATTSAKVDAPEITWAPTTDGTGGMKLTITKSDDDATNVTGYEVVVKGDDGSEITVTVTADGSASYEKVFTAAQCKPGVEYTVEVVAKAKGTGFANSDKVSAADTAGLVNLDLSDLVVSGAGLTDAKDWGNVDFNGYTQSIDESAITLPTQTGYTNATGALTITYSLTDAASGATGGELNAAQYNIYITVADGTYYKGFTNVAAGTWTIKQIQAVMALTKSSGSAQKEVGYNLTQAAPTASYTILAGQLDNAAYTDGGKTSGTVTSKYDYEYYIKTLPADYPASGGRWTAGQKIPSPTAFEADHNGAYVIEVKAVENASATVTYKGDLSQPDSMEFTLMVSDRVVTKVEILANTATVSATYGTPDGSYMPTSPVSTAEAKQMDRTGLIIRVTYEGSATPVDYVVGVDAPNVTWHIDKADNTGASTDVTAGTGHKLDFKKATSANLWVELGGVKSTASDANKHVTYTLDAKKLNYTVDANDKTYGEATSGGSVTINANQVLTGDTVTISATTYTLTSENVGTPTVSATGVALDGANKDFYALGTATNNTITISAATIGTVTVKTQEVKVGETIIKTIDNDKNKVTATGLDTTKSTITWEKKVGNDWVEVSATETTFQAGTEYRPVVKVTADDNHKLVVNDNYTIDADKHGVNNATITTNNGNVGNTGTFTGNSTKLAGTPVLKFQDVKVGTPGDTTAAGVDVTRNVSIYTGGTLGSYTITLSNAGEILYAVDASTTSGSLSSHLTPTPGLIGNMAVNGTQVYTLDLSGIPTNAVLTGQVIITARGNTKSDSTGSTIQATYTFNLTIANAPPVPDGGGGGGGSSKLNVKYDIDSKLGSTKDKTTEQVEKDKSPDSVPTVTVKDAEKNVFVGWTLDPKAEKIKLVNPKEVVITEDTTFYAVFAQVEEHEHYIKGYDSGIFAPADNISRAQVAAIIARACLDGFNENNDYGNGGYSDVARDHWAASAIAYCTDKGVFVGVGEGMFEPERSITRQEFALVFARMAGLMNTGDMPFTDAGTTADWAMSGVYTAFAKGWLDGYADGTFKPWNNIARSEAVKIVNRYLNRGVDKNGIANVSGDLKQWPDVPESYWAYYEIIEASNDHTFYFTNGENPPEVYTKAYIEQASWGK